MRKIAFIIWLAAMILIPSLSHAGLWDWINKNTQTTESAKKSVNSAVDIKKGIKEVIMVGIKHAVSKAGKVGGFLNNPEIRIPPPPSIAKATSMLRQSGLATKVKDLEESMNHAAEKAVAKAMPIFLNAVRSLTLKDINDLIHGGDHAITDYFRSKTWNELYSSFLPVVKENLNKVGVTKKYQEIVSSNLFNTFFNSTNFRLDTYVTNKAMGGLFKLLAEEEARIRKDPAARTTELLRKIFQ